MTKPVIVTRAGKGSPLTSTQGDSNFTNLQNATITVLAGGTSVSTDLNDTFEIEGGTGVTITGNNTTKKVTIANSRLLSSETSPSLGGNLNVSGNSIVSTSNGNISITPNGTGSVVLDGQNWPQADGTANQYLKTNGSGQLSYATLPSAGIATVSADATPVLGGDLDVSTFKIVTSTANRNIELDPHGTGVVAVTGPMTISGNLTVNGTTTTVNSTTVDIADLNITLAKGAASAAAANGAGFTIDAANATFNYNSTTDRMVSNKTIASAFFSNGASDFSGATIALGTVGNVSITGGTSGYVLRTDGAGVLTWVAQNSAGIATVSADTTPSLGGNLNVNGNSIVSSSNGNITLAPNGTGKIVVGSGSLGASITSNGAYNLILNTNSGTDSGQIIINQGINGNIALTPNGTGKVRLYGVYSFPTADGSADQFLKTDGSGNLSFATPTGSFVATATADLNMATFKIKTTSSQNLAFETASSSYGMDFKSNTNKFGYLDSAVTVTTNGTGNLTLSTNSGTSSGTIVITNGADGNITFAPNGVGKVYLNGAIKTATTSGTPATYNTSYFEGTLDTPASWLKIDVGGSNYYLPMFQ